ncbi:MAG: chemotaxis protein CheC [bacterium]
MNTILTKAELDQLAEVVNIGGGNAATAFSRMIGKPVQMDVPTPFVGHIQEVQRILGNSDDTVLAVFLKLSGDIDGALAIIFPPAGALKFAELLTKNNKTDISNFTEVERSALREVGNILLGASITALGKFLNMNIMHSIPDVATDMLGAIMESVILEMGSESDEVLSFRVDLKIESDRVLGELFFLFDPKSSSKILVQTKKILQG